ncbi:hypothetical protein N4J53_18700 [Proteus mirabilis]|uniref:hypothetical protein n=2 Tax=Proteus mirabilis TaxID=584 RepID=UPI0021B1FDCE|nr:hypothetical protein [Proteus mirabilis]MCT7285527.1 hypothetical protein [Proteus mirabilis]
MDRIPEVDFEDMEHGKTYLWYRNTNDIDFAWLSDDGKHLITPEYFNDSAPDYWELSAGLVGVLYGPVNIETAIKPDETEE